ncbi:unnamed protein product [Lathyrus oleraceus]
MVNYDF